MNVLIFITKIVLGYATLGVITTLILLVFGWRIVEHMYGTSGRSLTGWKEPPALLATVLLLWPVVLICIWGQDIVLGKKD